MQRLREVNSKCAMVARNGTQTLIEEEDSLLLNAALEQVDKKPAAPRLLMLPMVGMVVNLYSVVAVNSRGDSGGSNGGIQMIRRK